MPEIAEIYEAHARAVYWSAYSMLRDESAAMDTMQTVFLRALEHEATLRCLAPMQAKSWLFTAARNASVDYIRKSGREVVTNTPPEEEAQSTFVMPEAFVVTEEMRGEVYAAVNNLPDQYRQPVLLYYFAHMQQHEIAEYLNINASTVRTRLKRAKARLYREMQHMQEGGALRE
ncbi:sigma-70 family RNA polymerase sigma factor [Christensenellaceae bacterium OttesenSCG-928-L17]|nr:sigma-70 family RNA polymerase sigma factor [Christensenellaceae bacterium OttesenSCG-928-L17]